MWTVRTDPVLGLLVQAVCDGCGPDCWSGSAPAWTSRGEGARALLGMYGWLIDEQRGMRCPECLEASECAAAGHQWESPEQAAAALGAWVGDADVPDRVMCVRCGAEPGAAPSGHPDAAAAALSAAEQQQLLALEAALRAP